MNTQDIYDKVVEHLRKQGPLDDNLTRGWNYINPENTCERCAKGVLMDEINTDRPAYWIVYIERALQKRLTTTQINLLNRLETIFELTSSVTWEKQFKKLAQDFNLIYRDPNAHNTAKSELASIDS